jgi:hypothetical protein
MTLTGIDFAANYQLGLSNAGSNNGAVLSFIVYNFMNSTFDLFSRCGIPSVWDDREGLEFVSCSTRLPSTHAYKASQIRYYPNMP